MASFVPFLDLNLPPLPDSPTEPMPNSRDFDLENSASEALTGNRQISSNERNRGNGVPTVDQGPSFITNRSTELVIIDNLTPEEQRNAREEVRRTRMLFESLRISFSSDEDECRPRPSLNAGTQMRNEGLWLNRDKRVVGSIPGVEIGDVFFNRIELCMVGLHGLIQAGIDFLAAKPSPTGEPIATSIILTEGHEDNEDHGQMIIYVGQNNRSKRNADQNMNGGNLALQNSYQTGGRIRVIRGFTYPTNGTDKVYVYDGLYRITETWSETEKYGYLVYKFRLVRDDDNRVPISIFVFKSAEWIKNAPGLCDRRYLSPDIIPTGDQERLFRVTFFNNVDNDDGPMHYEYISTPTAYHQNHGHVVVDGCGCVDGCFDNCSCLLKNGGKLVYNKDGVLIRGKPLIYECGLGCTCPPDCGNRVSQNGLNRQFEVFKSMENGGGWSVRSLDLIPAGHFICQYAGLVMTKEQARRVSEIRAVELIDGELFGDKWKEWGDISNVRPSYVPPTDPPSPPMDFVIDLARSRNLASYMRHENRFVVANVMVQKVMYKDHNDFFYPRLALFAMENIPPFRELVLDYNGTVNH